MHRRLPSLGHAPGAYKGTDDWLPVLYVMRQTNEATREATFRRDFMRPTNTRTVRRQAVN